MAAQSGGLGMKPPTGEEKKATRPDKSFELSLIFLPFLLANGKLRFRAASTHVEAGWPSLVAEWRLKPPRGERETTRPSYCCERSYLRPLSTHMEAGWPSLRNGG